MHFQNIKKPRRVVVLDDCFYFYRLGLFINACVVFDMAQVVWLNASMEDMQTEIGYESERYPNAKSVSAAPELRARSLKSNAEAESHPTRRYTLPHLSLYATFNSTSYGI